MAHPRSRGENVRENRGPTGDLGSSPLTRGKHGRDIRRCRHGGLIPAHAGKTGPPSPCPPTPRAHPRSRGENVFLVLVPPVAAGSSPLTRGKPGATAAGLAGGGLIPAHAGKTNPPRREGGKPQGSSPLTRGKHLVFGAPRYRAPGSSPLTRGKLRRSHVRPRAPRLIPAHAGKTRGCASLPGLSRAHPRSRGENAVEGLLGQVGMGSSPLTRGKLVASVLGDPVSGLIPAHAGKTSIPFITRIGSGAHPRSRGENLGLLVLDVAAVGSSPLTRGKPERSTRQTPSHGLIPAHAGKTTTSMRSPKTSRAHPRSRGENCGASRAVVQHCGSSPLTRGKRPGWARRGRACGLIPAHAGKTIGPDSAVNGAVAHPRSRGENFGQKTNDPGAKGSSPLTRGKHRLPGRGHHRHGLIPAHAGKTSRRRIP